MASNGTVTQDSESIIPLSGMYKEYFLDYASYVILERAVPEIRDGLKPVQRRILHSLKEKDDGRYHKVANIIGHTMQYHPHGDAAIGAALVNLGQKDLLIDCQGNWGDIRTGDSAAAARYIEARLTKFALEVAFNAQTTEWQISYDGRKNEPIALPMKFPLLLAQGAEGIAVGLSTKILPHNFIELIKASIKILKGKKSKIYPDFQTGGLIDITEYQGGKRGGKVKVRAKIEQKDKSTLLIKELPYGVTTGQMIDSIIKANDKGQIKIKKVVDNTAKDVEIQIDLPTGVSPSITIDALYAFTNCGISISPNACLIIDNKPHFLTVDEILRICTEQTKALLKLELEIKKAELEEKWHLASLEKIFIENRIYRDIEEAESFEEVVKIIDKGLRKYVITPSDNVSVDDGRLRLMRDITREDIEKLTEIRIKRISKYNKFKADERIAGLIEDLDQVKYDLDHLTDFAIAYFEKLLDKFGKGRERKTEITTFENIKATKVAANNAKLYLNRKEGFIGTSLKKDEFITDCSDIDDIIVFRKDGKFLVSRISDKVFVGKHVIHADVWKKADERTTYNLIYLDGATGRAMAKRFNVSAITRDKEYDMTKGAKGSKILYFSVQPNGESEVLQILLTPGSSAKKKSFEFDFGDIAIKGRGAGGNIVTKYPVKKISQISLGKSSLGARELWMDDVSGRINKDGRGQYLGAFDTGDQILAVYKEGSYAIHEAILDEKFDPKQLVLIKKYNGQAVLSAVHHVGEKGWTMVKRFLVESKAVGQKHKFISESNGSKLYFASIADQVSISYGIKEKGKKVVHDLDLHEFIDIKGWKAMGNKLGEFKIISIKENESNQNVDKAKVVSTETTKAASITKKNEPKNGTQGSLFAGDSIDLDI